MKSWVEINERLIEMERDWKDEYKGEWNSLLLTKVAGILKRTKYEEPKGKEEGEGKAKKRGKRKDVADIP